LGNECTSYLAVPPPAQQRPVCDPRLQAFLAEEVEIGADHMRQGVGPLLVGHDAMVEAGVVVAHQVAAAWLVEVLVLLLDEVRGLLRIYPVVTALGG